MSVQRKIEVRQIAAALVLLGIAVARIFWSDFASKTDAIFFGLVAVSLVLVVIPLTAIKSLKAGGVELNLETPQILGAVASLSLPHIENARLNSNLQALSHILPIVSGSRLLWIDDRPEQIIGERRLLRALGFTVVPVTSSDEARDILRKDSDFDLIVSDVQRIGDSYKVTGGVNIHEGVNFVVRLRTKFEDPYLKEIPIFVREIPIIFYAAYSWPKLVEFTRPARETSPEPAISNSVADFVQKVILTATRSREQTIKVPSEKTPTAIRSTE